MTFLFEFSEADTETLRLLLRDCVGVDSYNGLVSQFFSQLSEQERRQAGKENTMNKAVNFNGYLTQAARIRRGRRASTGLPDAMRAVGMTDDEIREALLKAQAEKTETVSPYKEECSQ